MWRFDSSSPQETLELGIRLGTYVPGGTVLALDGDLGAGKTLLAKGIAQGLAVDEHITSPTFTIVNQYLSGRLPFHHMDIYRIEDEEELWEIGIEEYFDNESVSVVEWPDRLGGILPKEHVTVQLEKAYGGDGQQRRIITISGDETNEKWLGEALNQYANTID